MLVLTSPTSYEYRPNSDFYYYCGLTEPESLIVLGKIIMHISSVIVLMCGRETFWKVLVYIAVERSRSTTVRDAH
jgi:hypothetical protein